MKPIAKPNLTRQSIAADLLDNKTNTRTETRWKLNKPIKDPKTYSEYKVDVAIPRIAGNVSQLNVDRYLERLSA
ncbi:Uncharacterised protein [Mycobacteroides abscessus subsp. abscessus]|uniref:hypothetical protein n=1 Tax=Mycobacteroides abscessus TaxID=36809 RepID=UPI000929F281|nr:hypothetical protein [Mycobacteroides abscessus]SHS98819.1 Uncharacterised protein [Mycobacteroides abscessus subsp. abscessus]SLK64537.1 Uncharacterised protein [Mycobacteroides abscessus subsp. abscessus]